MSIFDALRKTRGAADAKASLPDNATLIRDWNHFSQGAWHQYDVLLAARGYGWDAMLDWADYMAAADLSQISQVITSAPDAPDRDVTSSYLAHGGSCRTTPELQTENSILSVAGMSRTLGGAPMKIVWYNQTRVLRLFTTVGDESLILRYVETVARRTFGTSDAMKRGRPLPAET